MGRFINEVGEELAKRDEADRPGKAIVCIVTDGLENSSVDWTRERVKALVERQCSKWQWEFVFLGADMDAVQEGASVGVPQKSSLTFDKANAQAPTPWRAPTCRPSGQVAKRHSLRRIASRRCSARGVE